MDELSQQIARGLPGSWSPIHLHPSLPEFTRVAYSGSNGNRKLMFLLVDGPMRSAMPLFDANTQLRNSGVETVWLFEEICIPSTKHMLCASLEWMGCSPAAKIMNLAHEGSSLPRRVDISVLARAAAEQRLKIVRFSAGQLVNITFTTSQVTCAKCAVTSPEIVTATFHPTDDPGAPGLELAKNKIGRGVSKLIADALRGLDQSRSDDPQMIAGICCGCHASSPNVLSVGPVSSHRINNVELSSLAALELVRQHKTAWYIS